jgi:prepilin-type N-terminal cleavage/methylation domain-containing protein
MSSCDATSCPIGDVWLEVGTPSRTPVEDSVMNGGLHGDDHLEGGFTIIELMVVCVVLGILAGLVLLGVGPFQEGGVTAACRSEIDSLKTANVAYRAVHGVNASSQTVLLKEGYLERAPKYVTFSGGTTNPATPDGCDGGTLVAAPPVLPLTPGTGVTGISGTGAPAGDSGGWRTDVTVTVRDGAGAPVPSVEVVGERTDVTNARRCTTEADGTCLINTHHDDATESATWKVITVGGQDGDNADPSITCTKLPSFGCS